MGDPRLSHNYPKDFPKDQLEPPIWARRLQRAHLSMIETLPAFAAVVLSASVITADVSYESIGQWAQVFFVARLGHTIVRTLDVPYLRTPVYLVSWFSILMIGTKIT